MYCIVYLAIRFCTLLASTLLVSTHQQKEAMEFSPSKFMSTLGRLKERTIPSSQGHHTPAADLPRQPNQRNDPTCSHTSTTSNNNAFPAKVNANSTQIGPTLAFVSPEQPPPPPPPKAVTKRNPYQTKKRTATSTDASNNAFAHMMKKSKTVFATNCLCCSC